MKSSPLVSIITPCHNDGQYLLETVISVQQSTYDNVEMIVIDDCSDDKKTRELLSQIEQDFSFVEVIRLERNEGVCLARNKAILRSSGKYILPLDADDKISADYIAEAVAVLEKDENVSLVACDFKYFGKKNYIQRPMPFSMGALLSDNLFVVSSVFRRVDFDKIGGFNQNMKEGYEDWDFWISLLSLGGKVYQIRKVHFFYRIKKRKETRNLSISYDKLKQLRYNLWNNHKELYSQYYMDLFMSSEYKQIFNSYEYKIGKIILAPIRYILGK